MFVEVFGQQFGYGNHVTDPVKFVSIVPLNKVVNIDAIRTIDMVGTTMFADKKYHRITLTNADNAVDFVYISDQDYERIIHG